MPRNILSIFIKMHYLIPLHTKYSVFTVKGQALGEMTSFMVGQGKYDRSPEYSLITKRE